MRAVAWACAWLLWASPGQRTAAADPRALAADAARAVKSPEAEPGAAIATLASAPPLPRGGLAIAEVDVSLAFWRGGDRRPDGTRVRSGRAWARGRARYVLDRPATAGETVVLLDFASSMPREPSSLDEVALASYVDGPFDPGGLEITGHDGARSLTRAGPRRDVVVTLAAGATSFELDYAIDVPHRYWPFGCVRGRCSLSGALAPLPSEPAVGGVYLPAGGRVVAPAHWHVREAAFVDDTAAARRSSPRTAFEVVVSDPGEGRTPYPGIFFGPRWHRTQEWYRGVELTVLTPWRRPSGQVPDDPRIQYRSDVAGIVLSIAEELIDLLDALDRPPALGRRITVVQGPLRAAVAQAHPGAVMISDEAFELFPAKRFRRFHEDAIGRGLADVLAEAEFDGVQPSSRALWLSSGAGFALLQLWRTQRDARDEFAHDMLSRLTFVPAVDRFLYTQQASFSSAYFRGVEDEMPLRNHPLWFAHALPTGRRIHEKLGDLIGPEGLDRFWLELLAYPSRDPQRVAERAFGRDLGWFFAQWLGPYPAVDYAIVGFDSRRNPDGSHHHRIEVRKLSAQPLVEPVQLLVTEVGGKQHFLSWNGELGDAGDARDSVAALAREPTRGTHVFELDTAARVRSARLDPRSRTVQTPMPKANVDPLFDDRHPPRFRFLYTGVGLSIAASEFLSARTATARFNAVTGFASFESSLRRDLRRTGHVQIARDRETDIAVGLGTNLWFGRKVNRQRRRARVRLYESVSLLNGRSLDPRGGVRVTETVGLIDDTRGFAWWPERGRWLSLTSSARHTIRTDAPHDDRHDITIDAAWIQLWRLAKDHVIATSLFAEIVNPIRGASEFRALARVGGIGGLQGYGADEAFGRGVFLAQAEYRHVYVNDLHLNLAHLAWLRSLGGVLFAGTASASRCDRLGGWFGARSWYGTVGYALMGYFSILGVTPQLVRLEVAVPLVRYRGETCQGRVLPDYLGQVQGVPDATRLLPPVSFNLLFQHNF
ncbi:MAG: hypothetical protein IPH07_05400 [Deltaproteobacteria bacterium]|nr:hypothetical protein [Deltaproteobacteria bacterium]MBP7287483.1 hypothetical protein [Nannocystaceae bacterium]